MHTACLGEDMKTISESDFKRAMGSFPSGVTVVTTQRPDGTDVGMTVSAFSSLSVEPPLILVCIQNRLDMCRFIESEKTFGVSILAANQSELSNRFAGGVVDEDGQWQSWPDERDKFADLAIVRLGKNGSALLDGASTGLQCVLEHAYQGGDHTIYVGRITALKILTTNNPEPLVYVHGQYAELCAEPA